MSRRSGPRCFVLPSGRLASWFGTRFSCAGTGGVYVLDAPSSAGCGLVFLWCWHGVLKTKPRTAAGLAD